MAMSPPRTSPRKAQRRRRPTVRWSGWNLLLVLPLLALFTPIYNRVEPRLFGLPFFYWFQLFGLVFVVGVIVLVHRATDETEFEKYVERDREEYELPPPSRSSRW